MDDHDELSRRLRTELIRAMEPLTLTASTREGIRRALLETSRRGAAPAKAPRPSPGAGWPAWLQGVAGVARTARSRRTWSAAGAVAIAAAALTAVLVVPRATQQPRATQGAPAPPKAMLQLPGGRSPDRPTPLPSRAAAAPALPRHRAPTTQAPASPLPARAPLPSAATCSAGAATPHLVAPTRLTVATGRPTSIGVEAVGGCPGRRTLTATALGPPGPNAVSSALAVTRVRASAAMAAPAAGSAFRVRWIGRGRSGGPLPPAVYRVVLRLSGTDATASVRVRVDAAP
ncbi:MAG TPA: hypothetical protein VNN74_11500 [Candidatus Micrarchaeia archaeon]|nr:hypothetical protein [Candidatus Micrarchaeia archaeon]